MSRLSISSSFLVYCHLRCSLDGNLVKGICHCANLSVNIYKYDQLSYATSPQNVTCEVFTACLIDLCKALWEVMKSYYKTMQWHERYDEDIRQGRGQSTFNDDPTILSVSLTQNKLSFSHSQDDQYLGTL